MRVKCINDKWQPAIGCEDAPRPVFNDDYTVIETAVCGGVESFILAEFGDAYGYNTAFFATLPDSSADEMADAEREAIVNLETALV